MISAVARTQKALLWVRDGTDRRTDVRADGRINGQTNARMNAWTNGRTDKRMDRRRVEQSYGAKIVPGM